MTTMAKARKRPEIPNDLVGIAGVHYVAFELARRKMIVLATTRNTKGYDIVMVSSDGTRHANIQVESAQKRPNFWPMPKSEKIRSGRDDFYVLVRGIGEADAGDIECFLVTGKEARAQVKGVEKDQSKKGRANFPCIYVEGIHAEAGVKERCNNAWKNWTP